MTSGGEGWLDSPWGGGGGIHDACGVVSPNGRSMCSLPPGHYIGPGATKHSWESPRFLVISDILSRDPRWDLSVGAARHIRDKAADYVQVTAPESQPTASGGDPLSSLLDSLVDAAVHARQRLAEIPEDGLEYPLLFEVYDDLVSDLVRVVRLRKAAGASE